MFLVLNGLLFIGSTVFVWGQTSCSRLLYSPSVFSLMIMISMFLWRVWTPGSDWQCITLAKRSKLVLFICKESEKNKQQQQQLVNLGITTEDKLKLWYLRFCWFFYRRTLFLDLTEGAMVCLVSMLPIRGGQRVTYSWTVSVFLQSHISSWWISTHCFCVCDTDKTAPLAFEGDSVAADGHDGVVHVVVSLQRGVDLHHLEVHWDTAEPAKQTGKRHQEPSVTLMPSTSRQGLFWVFFGHSVQTWKPLGRDWAAQGRSHRQVWASQCVCLHTLREEAVAWDCAENSLIKLNKTVVLL